MWSDELLNEPQGEGGKDAFDVLFHPKPMRLPKTHGYSRGNTE